MAKHEFEMVRRAAKHAQYMHDKRQRVPLPDDDDEDAETTTTARARPTRTPLTSTEETTTARVRTTIVPVDDDTTSVPATTRARVPTTSASPTTTAVRAPLTTSTTPSTISTTPSTTSTSTTARAATRVPLTTSTTSSSSRSSSTSASSSVSGIGSNADSNNTAASSKGSSNTGAIAGAVIAVLAVLAIAAFFGLRWRKKRKAAAEDAALFPYAGGAKSGGNNDGAFGNKRQSGYNQQVDSYDDLHNNGYDNGYNNGEKPYQSEKPGMASYGALAMNSPNVPMGHEMGGGGNMAGVGRGSYATSHMSPGRDITSGQYGPGSFVGSPSFSQHQQERFSAHSANFAGPNNLYGNDPSHVGYPPQAQYGPQASMMRSSEESPISYTTQLPHHQHQALASAVGGALAGGTVAAAAASRNSGQQQAASAPIPAPLPSPGAQPVQQQQGPFADPTHEGKIYIVTRVFEPSMPDELVFFPGDKIQIVMSYDDGWCLGCNLSSEQREGEQPARGVFPRDCVEEYVEPAAIALPSSRAPSRAISESQEQELLHDEDTPLAEQSDLARAPTLPPIEMSRFSIGSNGNRSESRASTVKRQSMLKPTNAPTVVEDDEDPYGGVATSASPNTASFPPDIQVNAAPLAVKRTSHQFGSSQHIADYASQIADDRRLSTLDEENSQLIDEFPVTPRTATTPMSTSSPKSAARLSTAQSIKRSSSLVASKDADLFLALGDVDRK